MSYIGNEPIVSATRTVTESTATAGQTTFTANGGYTVGFIDVFVNGAQLQSTDFTATNGSTVTLSSACAAGDDVRLVAYGTFGVASLDGSNLVNASVTQAKLASGIAGTGPAFRATTATTQSFSINTPTKATCYTTEQWDTNSNYDNSTCRFTPTVAGYYQVTAGIQYGSPSVTPYLYVYKNGSIYIRSSGSAAVTYGSQMITGLVYMNGSTDYLEVYLECDGSGSPLTYQDTGYNFFSAAMVRSA